MTYQTCIGCVHGTGYCHEREATKAKVKGLGVTSLKWKCKFRRPVYEPGEAVWVSLFVGMYEGDWGIETPDYADFPGVVIRLKGSKAIIFVEPACMCRYGEYAFAPRNDGNGHVKVSLIHVKRREAVREHVCKGCERIVRLAGHEDYCRYMPREERRAREPEYLF